MAAAVHFSDVRESIGLLMLAVFGGIVAVAWGNRRLARPTRLEMVDARTQLQVLLDALRARTAVLSRRDDLTPGARSAVDEVVFAHVLIDSTLARAASASEVNELRPEIYDCLMKLEYAADEIGLVLPADEPFRGLCAIDPQHGAATSSPYGPGLCRACVVAIGTGDRRPVRLVAKSGRPVPFDEVEPLLD